MSKLSNSVWKERLAGMEELTAKVQVGNNVRRRTLIFLTLLLLQKKNSQDTDSMSVSDVETIVRQLLLKPSLKDSNVQVVGMICKLIATISAKFGVTDSLCALTIPGEEPWNPKKSFSSLICFCIFLFYRSN
jgi:hypothetical protein